MACRFLYIFLIFFSTEALSSSNDLNDKLSGRYNSVKNKLDYNKCLKLSSESKPYLDNLERLKKFTPSIKFLSLKRDIPIKISISEDYYNPHGSEIIISDSEFILEKNNPSRTFFILSKLENGLKILALDTVYIKDKLQCVADISVIVNYEN